MSEFEEELVKAADEILLKIRENSYSNHFVYGSNRPIPLKVTSRSGKLLEAVRRATTRGERATVTPSTDGMNITGVIRAREYPHALLIHEGGVRAITQKMRRFFWAKWYETRGSAENKMWGILRFRVTERYEPRKFLENAVMEAVSEIPEILRKHAIVGLAHDIKMMIEGAKGAVPLSQVRTFESL